MDNGGITGANSGNVDNCKNQGSIDAGYETGGIAGAQYSNGRIKNCVNEGNFIETFSGYDKGGILGINSQNGILEYCYNMSDIAFADDSAYEGIVGKKQHNGIIQYCFNKGNLTHTDIILFGGIAGVNSATIKYCYNTGNISSTKGNAATYTFAYGIGSGGNIENCYNIGEVKAPMSIAYEIADPDATIQNSYYLGTNLDDTTCKNDEFMKTQEFVDLLNSENKEIFCMDENGINEGYPILSWQKDHE